VASLLGESRHHGCIYQPSVSPELIPNAMTQLTQHSTLGTRTMSLKQLNVKIPEQELRILEAFAEKTERTKTDIIREFIRSLQSKV
jgi:Ribbon-helix-helix protein, copG family